MKHDENCECDICVVERANATPFGCRDCTRQFPSVDDAEDHWHKVHKPKTITAEEFDERSDNGEDMMDYLDVESARRQNDNG